MSTYQERPDADEYAPFYADYIARVPAGDLVAILRDQIGDTRAILEGLPESPAEFAYAPGKWTTKEVIGHLADTERVLSCRALRFARGDRTELSGFDEAAYVPLADFSRRTLDDLLSELEQVRRATVAFFEGLPPEAWLRRGPANGNEVSVRGLACIIAGHELHHRALLRERYLAPEIHR